MYGKHLLYTIQPNMPIQGDSAQVCDLRGTLGHGVLRTTSLLAPARQSPQRTRARATDAPVYVELTQAPTLQQPQGPQWEVWVACGSLKGGRADWLVEKCVELGAATLVPLLTARSPTCSGGDGASACYNGGQMAVMFVAPPTYTDGGGRVGRWQRLAVAAGKQCLRVHGMQIMDPTPIQVGTITRSICDGKYTVLLQVLVDTVRKGRDEANVTHLVATAGGAPVAEVLQGACVSRGLLVVGPEGDFTEEELKALMDAGALAVGLGPLRLRVETAALAALCAVQEW